MTLLSILPNGPHNISTHILTKRMTICVHDFLNQLIYFNSHPHEEDDQLRDYFSCSQTHFNSHPHEEDDGVEARKKKRDENFNSHPHEEDDTAINVSQNINRYFNSHPHEEDDLVMSHLQIQLMYFNSHPHEEDDSWIRTERCRMDISTHILTKRMTEEANEYARKKNISTHILTKRMTCTSTSGSSLPCHFNSHPHEEDDQ